MAGGVRPGAAAKPLPFCRRRGQERLASVPAEAVHEQHRFVGSIEDERRLFYVAMTRSQKFLYMTWAPGSGEEQPICPEVRVLGRRAGVQVCQAHAPGLLDVASGLQPEPQGGHRQCRAFVLSDLKYFFECPYQFKLRILYGFNAPIYEGLGYGKSLHDALADVHARAIQGKAVDESHAPSLVGTHLHLPYAYKALRERWRRAPTAIVHNYIAANKADFDNIEFSEKSIETHLGDGVSVVGRIDLVRRKSTPTKSPSWTSRPPNGPRPRRSPRRNSTSTPWATRN